MTKRHRRVWDYRFESFGNLISHEVFLSHFGDAQLCLSWCQAFLSPHLSNLSPLCVGWEAAPSCGWVSMFPRILFFFFFPIVCLLLHYLLLVHELSHPTSNILGCSLALWHFSLNPFLMQGVSRYVALKNKIKTPWERSFLKRYFFLSLSFSPWVLLKVWYRRGISVFLRGNLSVTSVSCQEFWRLGNFCEALLKKVC